MVGHGIVWVGGANLVGIVNSCLMLSPQLIKKNIDVCIYSNIFFLVMDE